MVLIWVFLLHMLTSKQIFMRKLTVSNNSNASDFIAPVTTTEEIHEHCVQKKTPTYVFDYNSGVSWSIFILFVAMEIEMITL